MRYQEGRIGRVFVARFEHGEDLLAELKSFAQKENVEEAVFYLLGALQQGGCVCGPSKSTLPPEPLWQEIKESHELLGVGTIFQGDDKPLVHLHCAFGRGSHCMTGCLRGESGVYLVVEAVIMELQGIKAKRVFDSSSGLTILDFL